MNSKTKNLIISSTFNLLTDHNLNNLTIKMISEKANISRKSFYNNFKNINEVISNKIESLVLEIYNLYILNIKRNKNIKNYFDILLKFINNNITYFKVIKNKFFIDFKKCLDNLFISKTNNKYKYLKISGSIINLILYWMDSNIDLEEYIKTIF